MNNRKRGDYFERQTRDALVNVGWYVIRSAGSLGVADLVALRYGNTPLLVSCKISGRIDPRERGQLMDAADAAGARAVVAMRPRNGRVLVAAVHRGTARLVPIDTLRVPIRRKARPDPEPGLPLSDDAPLEHVAEVPDGLLPHGVQMTLPEP